MKKRWAEQELSRLRTLYGSHSCSEIGRILGRTTMAVESKALYLGLVRTSEQRKTILQANGMRSAIIGSGQDNGNWKGGVSTDCYRRYRIPYRKENPEKKRANDIAQRAVRSGTLVRMSCEICGNPNTHAHHDDYSKPLEVQWLCAKHHQNLHHKGRRKECRIGQN